MHFPDDDNGQLLKEMADAGVDLTQIHPIDFFILFEQEADATRFADDIKNDELAPKAKLGRCPDTGVWEVLTTVSMVPDHTLLGQTEQYLENIANGYNGYGDGWGILAEE